MTGALYHTSLRTIHTCFAVSIRKCLIPLSSFHTPIRLSHSSYSPFTLLLAFPSFLSHPSVLPLHPPTLSHSCHTSALLSFHTLFLPLSISTGTPPSSCRIPHFLLSHPLIFVSLFTLVLAHPSFPATLFLAYPFSFLVTPLLSFHTPPFTSFFHTLPSFFHTPPDRPLLSFFTPPCPPFTPSSRPFTLLLTHLSCPFFTPSCPPFTFLLTHPSCPSFTPALFS